MKNYEPVMTFDEDTAETYDDGLVHAGNDPGQPAVGDVDATVTFLDGLARGGPALELVDRHWPHRFASRCSGDHRRRPRLL